MINIYGTIYDSVKMTELENKWKQKKEKINSKQFGLTEEQQTMLEQYKKDLENIKESNHMSEITTKIKTGGKLTYEEIKYLKEKNPQALKDYEQTKREKAAFERDLRKCRTKEEVERLKLTVMGNFMAAVKDVANNANIPKGQKLAIIEKILSKVNNFNDAHEEFTKTLKYKDLPTDEEKREMEEAKLNGDTEEKLEASDDNSKNTSEVVDSDGEIDENSSQYVKDFENDAYNKAESDDEPNENLEELVFENPFNEFKNVDSKPATYKETVDYIVEYLKNERTTGSGLEYFTPKKKKNNLI